MHAHPVLLVAHQRQARAVHGEAADHLLDDLLALRREHLVFDHALVGRILAGAGLGRAVDAGGLQGQREQGILEGKLLVHRLDERIGGRQLRLGPGPFDTNTNRGAVS